jgi:hypothetical protein
MFSTCFRREGKGGSRLHFASHFQFSSVNSVSMSKDSKESKGVSIGIDLGTTYRFVAACPSGCSQCSVRSPRALRCAVLCDV